MLEEVQEETLQSASEKLRGFESLLKSQGWALLVKELEQTKQQVVNDSLQGKITENEAVNSAYLKGFYQAVSNVLDLPTTMVEDYLKPMVEDLQKAKENEDG